jgi:hypothetical protein
MKTREKIYFKTLEMFTFNWFYLLKSDFNFNEAAHIVRKRIVRMLTEHNLISEDGIYFERLSTIELLELIEKRIPYCRFKYPYIDSVEDWFINKAIIPQCYDLTGE